MNGPSETPIPGPPDLPLMGHRPRLLPLLRAPATYLEDLHTRYGDVVSLARGRDDHVFLFGPEPIRTLLGDGESFVNMDAGSSPLRIPRGSSLQRLYGGLTSLNGPDHTRLRRIVRSALSRDDVESYAVDIAEIAQRHVRSWRPGDRVDLLEAAQAMTLEAAVSTLLGVPGGPPNRDAGRTVTAWIEAVFSLPAMMLPLDVPGLPYRRLLRVSARLEAVIREVIVRHRQEGDGRDVLSRLMASGEGGVALGDDELVGQTAFLFMAGHATTASALTWTVLLLCAHPGVLADVVDELDAKLDGRAPTAADLSELPMLGNAVRESLRLLPPVVWWSRIVRRPAAFGPYRVRAGSRVAYSPYVVHRRPDLYPRPRAFLPERWLTARPSRYEYLPFSAGVRSCLGAGFATMEITTILAVLLQNWRPELVDDRSIDRGGLMVAVPKNGLPVVVRPPRWPVRRPRIRGDITRSVDLEDDHGRRAVPG